MWRWCQWTGLHPWSYSPSTYVQYRICNFCYKGQRKVLDHGWRDA